MSELPAAGARGLRIASPQDCAAGVFLIAFGAFAWWASGNLPMGTLRAMGPGMLPKSLAVILAGLGFIMVLQSLKVEGPALEPWNWRALFFVLVGATLFALSIRGFDLPGRFDVPAIGLIAAGPLVAIISAFASPETRWSEVLIFAAFMTALCAGLFKYALGLPIPLAPWLLGY
jgi:putative tricarboxylic transport membrane protein